MNNRLTVVDILIIVVSLSVFAFIKIAGPLIIEQLYVNQQIDILNQLTHASSKMSLLFYKGLIEDLYFGPVCSLVSGIAFFVLGLKFLRESTFIKFVLGVFVYLLITRFEVLFYPPYGDVFTGPFSGAIWLARHGYDYGAYLQTDSFSLGGPKIYPTSIFPVFLAFMIKVTPNALAFLVSTHLVILFVSACCIGFVKLIAEKLFSKEIAIYIACIVLFLPMFQSMSELINMEMTCLLFALAAVYFSCVNRYGLASFSAILSLMTKAPGGIACATVLACAILRFISQWPQERKYINLFWGGLAFGAAVIKAVLRQKFVGVQTVSNNVEAFVGLHLVDDKKYFWAFCIILVAFIGYFMWSVFSKKNKMEALKEFIRKYDTLLAITIISTLWFFLYMNFASLLYRYELLLIPFISLIFAQVTFIIIRKKFVQQGVLIAIMALLLIGSHGRLYMPITVNGGTNTYERSLEYRNDLKLHMEIAKEIETHYPKLTVGAPVVIAQALDFNEVGYVDQKLDVMMYGMKSPHESIKDFKGITKEDLNSTIWVGLDIDQRSDLFPFPVDPNDKILKKFEVGDKRAVLFAGGFAIEKMRRLILLKRRSLLQGIGI